VATAAIERALKQAVGYAKMNYLMLMMVDPHVHFHIFPRYEGSRLLDGQPFDDKGWPGPPDLASGQQLAPGSTALLMQQLVEKWTVNQ
jgi:diadenosine tetraphosphate (Ap4A) HIT family hydrolase